MSIHVSTLVECASDQCLAVVYYRKGVASKGIKPRLIEPYCFTGGRQDLMIRCFQLEHDGDADESGWRFFMVHKIDRVEKTTLRFKPRRKIKLPTFELSEQFEPDPSWSHNGRRSYRDYVGDAIADGRLDPDEIFDLEKLKSDHRLTEDDLRFVHASVYHRCLGSVLEDGFFCHEEIEQIRFLHNSLRLLGWAVGD